jgi:hypothetical protein
MGYHLFMSTTTQVKQLSFNIVGLIGESADFFKVPVRDVHEIYLDMEKATYINSIGVKNWIMWTAKVPKNVKVTLAKCPFVVANQAATVAGFMPENFKFESFFAPFVCPSCENESMILLSRTVHFEYEMGEAQCWYKPPVVNCKKCAGNPELEPDFFADKIISFLKIKKN